MDYGLCVLLLLLCVCVCVYVSVTWLSTCSRAYVLSQALLIRHFQRRTATPRVIVVRVALDWRRLGVTDLCPVILHLNAQGEMDCFVFSFLQE